MVLGIRGRAGTGRSRAHICAYSKSTIGASVDPLQPRSQPASPTGITNWPNTPRQFLTPPASCLPPAYALSYPRRSARVRARAHCHYPRPEPPSTLCPLPHPRPRPRPLPPPTTTLYPRSLFNRCPLFIDSPRSFGSKYCRQWFRLSQMILGERFTMRFSGWWPNPIQSGPIFWAQSPSGTAERLLGILPGGCPPALGAIKRTVGFKGEAQGYQALGTEFRGWTPGVAPIGSRMKNRLRFRPPSVKGVGQRASELSAWIE